MAKRHTNRPALRAVDVWRWIDKGILKAQKVPRTAVFFLIEGRHIRQSWLTRTRKRNIIRRTAITYLGEGIFLIPIWQEVPDWEMEWLESQDLHHEENLTRLGIHRFRRRFFRLCYMQVEDLDHAARQQVHVLKQYFDEAPLTFQTFRELFRELSRQGRIAKVIVGRQVGVDAFRIRIQHRIRSLRSSVASITAHAPLFCGQVTDKDIRVVTTHLEKLARQCEEQSMRPVGRRLRFAARSLRLAAEYIQQGKIPRARRRLKAALKNLVYPEEKPKGKEGNE